MISLHLYDMSGIGKPIETESRLMIIQSWTGWEDWWAMTKGSGVSFWGDENIKLIVVMDAQHREYTKSLCIVCLKWVNFMEYELYLN